MVLEYVVVILIVLYFINYIVQYIRNHSFKPTNTLITGCDSGFGHKTALKLNELNIKVFAGCLTQNAVDQFNNDSEFKGIAFLMDVTNKHDIEAAYKLVKNEVKEEGLCCLVNNAGILKPGPIEWQSTEEMQNVMNVNLWGSVNVTRMMIPLIKKTRGRIVNVTSMAGRVLFPHSSAYCMSKYALEAFSDGLRYEMKPWGISVHIIEPGMHRTAILAKSYIINEWKNLWNKQTDEIKEAYGPDYYNRGVEMMSGDTFVSSKVYKVIDAITHAVLSTNPKLRYMVGVDASTIWMTIATFPTFVGDFILDVLNKPATPADMKQK